MCVILLSLLILLTEPSCIVETARRIDHWLRSSSFAVPKPQRSIIASNNGGDRVSGNNGAGGYFYD